MKAKISASCDKGTARVWCGGSYCSFDNGVGDINFKIYAVKRKENKVPKEANFLGDFYSDGTAEIDSYDCGEKGSHLYRIPQGRYGVFNYKGNIYFEFWEDHI